MSTSFSHIVRLWRVIAAAVLLSLFVGCSTVKLDDNVPVTERAPTPVGNLGNGGAADGAAGASSASVENRTVVPVQSSPASDPAQPPAALSRIIYFDFDDYTVKPEFTAVLEAHARFLNADRQRRVVLEGHTDERGGREYNLALGQKRADAVRRVLALLGVQDAQMESVSFGEEKPAVQGSGEEAWSQNRRVELVYR